ncbi:MAG: signal peptidase I [Adlercreutzia sp.]|uniref:signal peptidase I n=1 Tax=uncultured Adlercreutzia sp. TaxID=875803 RepID=UPI00216B8124|nr:signal peptidase I [uncultured Adlercreutzia sp.]MCI8424651.1 signal peptidase I [Adlercreutzia sp.]
MESNRAHIHSETAVHDAFSQSVQRRLRRFRAAARLFTVLGVLLLGALLAVAVAASVAPRLIGLQSYAIISGSMEPAYLTGSLVYAEPIAGADLQEGDVAAFWRDQDVVIHRVVTNDGAEQELVTKGDANAENDVRPVPYANVLGRVTVKVPYVGYFLMALGSTPGKLLLGWIVLMGAVFCIIGSVLGGMAKRSA